MNSVRPLQVAAHPVAQASEAGRRQLLVDLAPPDVRGGLGLVDDELVLHRAAGVDAGLDDQRAICGEAPLAAPDRVRDQRRGAEVGVQIARLEDARAAQILPSHHRVHRSPLPAPSPAPKPNNF